MNLSLNQPGFESLRNFVINEMETMTLDYAQVSFKSDEKDASHDFTIGL